jgi:hypothetical protein
MKTWTKEQLIDAVKSSKKYIEVAQKLGLTNLGSNYYTIKKYIKLYELDISHFMTRKEICSEARKQISELTNEEIFCVNSIDRKHIKNRILRDNLIEYKCQRCGITVWEGEKLSLHLDHINGVNNDNRLENLRFLCPNCHSLTDTYCAKNKINDLSTKKVTRCILCEIIISHNSLMCKKCNAQNRKTKINWPNDDELIQLVKASNYQQVGTKLGVSGNAVKKRLHTHGLLIPK